MCRETDPWTLCSRMSITSVVAKWYNPSNVVVLDTSPVRRDVRSAFLVVMSDCRVVMLSCSFCIERCRKEGLVVGVNIRVRARACVCRWVDSKNPI
jgi:hypothetical protein